ncbi:MAG: hypothetical protein J6P57_07455 [Lachnospiraceae bacterium]|nr:hypothetical protein [Lachnospiraceae bacterium]
MSSIVYVVPWAICETDNIYTKKITFENMEKPSKGDAIDDWCIRDVMASPDKRSKDIYAVVDVYNGYKEKLNEKGMSVFSLNNSAEKLTEYGYKKAEDKEADFIRNKVLKLGKK